MPPRSSKTPKRPTLHSLAAQLGVTANTVSAALRGTGRVGEAKREEIRRFAAEMGYQPHLGAQSLRVKHTRHVGLLLNSEVIAYGFQYPILRAFTAACGAKGLRYQVEWCPPQQAVPRLATEGMVDGLVIGGKMEPAMDGWLASKCPLPLVPLSEPGPYGVLSDAAGNQRKVVDFLASLGHRRIALMAVPGDTFTFHAESTRAFGELTREAGLDTDGGKWIICHQDPHTTSNRQPLEAQLYAIFRSARRPTAVVCMGLNLAQVVLVAALRAGLAIPYELSIVVHTAEHMAAEAYPRFSVLDPDSEAMAEHGLDSLAALLAGKHPDPAVKRIPGRLIVFDTTAIAPR